MEFNVYSHTRDDLKKMPQRRRISNKGDYGRLLCVCGSVGMCGAAYLTALAAYRTGAGLVRILTVKENLIPLQTALPEAIVSVYDSASPDVSAVLEALEWADAVVIGCGLGRSSASRKILGAVLRNRKCPTVADADALNLISETPSLKKYLSGIIITPHLLEMARICGCELDEVVKDKKLAACEFARKNGSVCVLKSHGTCVSDGSAEMYVNNCGNSGMATAGSGDVLAGVIGGILAQNKNGELSLTEAATLGVYIHSLAGDLAAEKLGEYSLMARDIIDALPDVLRDA